MFNATIVCNGLFIYRICFFFSSHHDLGINKEGKQFSLWFWILSLSLLTFSNLTHCHFAEWYLMILKEIHVMQLLQLFFCKYFLSDSVQ